MKSKLLEKIVLNSGFICFMVEKINKYNLSLNDLTITDELVDDMLDLIESMGKDRGQELQEIFKTISNRLLDFGLEHTLEYLRKGE